MSKSKAKKAEKLSKSKKSNKNKKEEETIDQETIEFLWSKEVQNGWDRIKHQLEKPLEGCIPPIPGLIDIRKDVYISQLAQMYADLLQDRLYKKKSKLWASYDQSSLEHMVRNFCSPAFYPRRIVLPEITDFKKSEEEGKETIKNNKQVNKKDKKVENKLNKNKASGDKKKKNIEEDSVEEIKAPTIPWKINVHFMNIFPELYLSPSLLSLISEPIPPPPIVPTEESDPNNLKESKKDRQKKNQSRSKNMSKKSNVSVKSK